MHYEKGGSLNSILCCDKTSTSLSESATVTSHEAFSISNTISSGTTGTGAPGTFASNTQPDLTYGNSISLVNKIRIVYKIAQCLGELHNADIIHGDLKPANILLSSTDITDADVCLTDFGFSEIRNKNLTVGESSLVNTTHQYGTPIYSAPEMLYTSSNPQKSDKLSNDHFLAKPSKKTDIYSFSILTWVILTQQKPFNNIFSDVELSLKVHQGVRPDVNQLLSINCPSAIREMIGKCWDSDRNIRLTSLNCCTILRECYFLLSTMEYDIYLSYRQSSNNELLVSHIRNQLIENGFKVAWKHDNASKDTEHLFELIKKSKILLACLDQVINLIGVVY